MELDRRYITRRDFPAARRGYDPDEVDSHLRELADAVEDLRREAEQRPQETSVAGAAAEQVRVIVEAAERSATEIEERAHADARRARDEADAAAREARQRADAEAAEHIRRVEEATRSMIQRADQAESQVGEVIESIRSTADELLGTLRSTADGMVGDIRTGAEQLGRELEQIRRGLGDVRDARTAAAQPAPAVADPVPDEEPRVVQPPEPEPEPERQPEPAADALPDLAPTQETHPEPEPESLKIQGDELHPGDVHPAETEVHETAEGIPPAPEREPFIPEPEPEPVAEAEPEPEPEPAGGGTGGAGSEGARLIALNMALNGTPREETAAYLSENFDLADQDALLDEVYARAG